MKKEIFRNSNEITDEEIIQGRKIVLDKLGLTTESEKYSEACETLDSLEVATSDLVHFTYLNSGITGEEAFEMITNYLKFFLELKIIKSPKT